MVGARRVLNLGCGTKTSSDAAVLNVDWSPMLRIRSSRLLRPLAPFLLTGERRRRFESVPDNVLVHDLSKGLPFPDGSVDVVYHSHVLEHIDREHVEGFFAEVRRVLRPGGVHRVVVPDFEEAARAYVRAVEAVDSGEAPPSVPEAAIDAIISQMVRRHAAGTSNQRPLRRKVENLLLGDARKRGETHQWMYDRHTLATLFRSCEFAEVRTCDWGESAIPGWSDLGLEVDEAGQEYRPGSIYVEGVKPRSAAMRSTMSAATAGQL